MVFASLEMNHPGHPSNGRDILRTGGESEKLLFGAHGERSRAGRDADEVDQKLAENGYSLNDVVDGFLGKSVAAAAILVPWALKNWAHFREVTREALRISL
jgi:hypothetical protein